MTRHHARLVAVAITAVSFSTPITAQQEPAPPTTLEALLETLGEGVGHENEQGEVVVFTLIGDQATDASLAHLSGLTALEKLNLMFAEQVTDAGLVHLAGLTALEQLYLSGTQVTDAGLAHLTGLPALRQLDLFGTEVTAAGLVHLQKMPALRRLGLSGYFSSDRLTDADIANLREALPNVRISDGAPITPPPPPPPPPPQ